MNFPISALITEEAKKQFIREFLAKVANTTASLDYIVSTLSKIGFTRDQISDGIKEYIDART